MTCGERGAWVLSSNREATKVAAPALTAAIVDTVGAGDAFAAICILGLLHHWHMEQILTRASIFASAICTIRGAAPETNTFYLPYIERWF